jgi:3D (Asp-Asp-Asp) domain-containing protein
MRIRSKVRFSVTIIIIVMLITTIAYAVQSKQDGNFGDELPIPLLQKVNDLYPIDNIYSNIPVDEESTVDIDEDKKEEKKTKNNYRIVTMEVTAYTAGYESTGKTPDHPEYGITASGEYVKPHSTVAASTRLPFGTKLRIPAYEKFMGFEDKVQFVVEDRGEAITKGKLDIYIEDVDTALKWGIRKVEVIIYEEDEEGEI